MIDLIFYYGSEIIFVRIDNFDIKFSNSIYGAIWAPIDGLKLSKSGVIKEHPDLEFAADWKEQAIKRFKIKLHELGTEEEICKYIIEDLRKYGYVPKFKQKQGFRRVALQ